MNKYKILHLIPYINSQFGGPPYVAKSLNNLFNKSSFNSKILTLEEDTNRNILFFKLTTKKFWFSFDFMINSIKYIKNSDIIFIHGIYSFVSLWGSIIAILFNKKVFLLPHGMLDKNSINSSGFIKNSIRKIFLYTIGLLQIKLSNKIIFNSQKEKINSLFANNSMVIPNGVDVEYIDNVRCNNQYFEKDKINLFFLGRLNKIKGIELILEAINQLDDDIKEKINFVIAGTSSNEYVEFLQSVADKAVVKFIGHIEGSDKYCFLKQCDIYLQPSFTEGLSISMLEAMACKVKMITTNRVGLFEELKINNAAKVIDYDKHQLQLAIIELIKKENNYKNNCYKMIKEKYNWNKIIEDYKKLMGEN